MNSSEEIEEVKSWLSALDINSEHEAISKEIILNYIDQLETNNQKLIEKLEKDIVNITKSMHNGKYLDDYRRCRLKAYRTKTQEILEILKGEKK